MDIDESFSGVVHIERGGTVERAEAHGFADRRWSIPNSLETRFALASGSKTFTAVAVLSLVEEGTLALDTPARDLLGDDLPLIAADVTIEHLLSHRSGIGDYLDEEEWDDITAYAMGGSVHLLETTEAFLPILDGYPTAFPAGERFAYNNGGFVVLAILAERASDTPFVELVQERVIEPAGMVDTEYLRADSLPTGTAVGYLLADGLRTNALHLPMVGSGDGGAYSTVADVGRFWKALDGGRLLPPAVVADMVRPRSEQYGLGLWLDGGGVVHLEGYDAGVSFRSTHDAAADLTITVISNWSDGAWPVVKALAAEYLGG
jgi:CubicO group peptidase (beta-lactamase class C family)